MCQLAELSEGKYVADIKLPYIQNIIEQAKKCPNISRIMLFGSALETRCREDSDIDIAVFGEKTQARYLQSKEFLNFNDQVFSYNGILNQDYDVLYFKNHSKQKAAIMNDIENGLEIYRRL